ncbi:MAG: CoA transferase, partial [Candidatus Acidiferrales bacterium]
MMLGPFDYALWLIGFLLEIFVVVCALYKRDFVRYFPLIFYMMCEALVTLGQFYCVHTAGFNSLSYVYYYYYTDSLLAELGADVVKVEPPGGEGGFQMMPVLPNIYVDANRSKRGIVLDLKTPEDRVRLLDLVAASDVVVENAMAGAWERLGLEESALRAVNPALVYARAKGFGVAGPLASRPCFDYVVQAATGMEMTQGGGVRPVPVNFTANDYGTGLLLGAGIVLALLGRSRGVAVTGVDASLALTATVFQSEDVAALATVGSVPDQVGADLLGVSRWQHLYRAKDG